MIQATDNFNASLRQSAMEEVTKTQAILGKKLAPLDFIREVSKKFIEMQIDAFPMYCQVARMQNKIKQDEIRRDGIKGKYTDSYGWSEKHLFKHDYEIPSELYLFMQNLVYKQFWDEDNEKVWRDFMKAICRGDDPMQLLMKVKMIYGSNMQKKSVVEVG